MKALIVEDDFITRRLLESFLTPYGKCDITVNGVEAVSAFRMALEEKEPYQLICLDVLLPEMDGGEVLKEIRNLERDFGIDESSMVQIIIISIIGDTSEIKVAFQGHCAAIIPKPVEKRVLTDVMVHLGLIN